LLFVVAQLAQSTAAEARIRWVGRRIEAPL
jgi:hypothetical protein